MVKTTVHATDSESESEMQSGQTSAAKDKHVDKVDEEAQEGDEPEEEYEIERILDAKHGTFPGGRVGFLVKWKGYGEEHNSWVDEKDTGNADILVKDFWRRSQKEKKEKGGVSRKSISTAPKAKPRKSSAARQESSEVEAAPPKKRGRPSGPSKAARSEEPDEESPAPQKKKPRKSKADEPMDEDEPEEFRDLTAYLSMPSWEHIVQSIDTVERRADGKLVVYFTLKGKGRAREVSSTCKKKMPQKLLAFYEENLRWKPEEDDEARE